MKITSKRQQRFFGAVASGKAKKSGLRPAKARLFLRENKSKMRNLPDRAPKARTSSSRSKSGRR